MSARVVMKRLAPVEVNPASSNQHEFNAGRLRRELKLKGNPCKGAMEFLFFNTDDAKPAVVHDSYTLYDARRNDPARPPEWRMYYTTRRVADYARADDLMLLFRVDGSSNDLIAVVLRKGTHIERSLVNTLADREPEELTEQTFVDSKDIDSTTRRLLQRVLDRPAPNVDFNDYPFTSLSLYKRSVADNSKPSTAEMAAAAQGILADLNISERRPDDYIFMALEVETALFMIIEEALGNIALADLYMRRGTDFVATMRVCLSYEQSRKSRRGRSLENHFRTLLKRLRIPHGYQCTTEPGRTPDFVFPSCGDYHDPTFPSANLRMVGCKTRVRERHTQWLHEAARIPLKFALCVDDRLTDAVVRRYQGKLRFFMPKQLLDSTYATRTVRPLLGSVTDLIGELHFTGRRVL